MNASGPTTGPACRHAAPARRPIAVGRIQPALTRVWSGRASTSSGAATAISRTCWTMWPVKLRSAARSSHGIVASTIAPMPPIHAASRHPAGSRWRSHAAP